MKKIPPLPKQSKLMAWLKRLPVSVQFVLICILLYLTWHFRYYTTGVDEAELMKITGTLYSFECRVRTRGSDNIILYTSLQNKEIWFSGWQKCNRLTDILPLAQKPQQVVFYTQRHHGIFNQSSEGALWIYAIDQYPSNKPLIYPARGLGIRYNPNVWCLVFFFIALALMESLRERWVEQQAEKKKGKDKSKHVSD